MSEKIGRFEIVGKLGRGAFGMVYKGRDPVINRLAAIKVMSEATVGDPELVARFKREAEAAGGLNHRNIVTIYDLGDHNNLPYIAMEFLEGKDLERILKDRTEISMERRIDIIAQTAEGLHYAHSKGIVHRDIKPANIRLLDDGTVKIMDFGIAKMSSSDMTRTGQFMGTVNYMSPEQIKAKKIDGRSDLFALGVMFYEFVSYRRPFPGDSITAVIYKIVNENPPPLTELQGTPNDWLEGVIFKCLEKDVNKRWESCQALADALRSRQKVAVNVGKSTVDQTINIARRQAEAGDVDTAIRRLDEILEQDPENLTALKQKKSILAQLAVKQSETLISSGRLEQARDQLLKARDEVGESEEITKTLADVQDKIKATRAEQMFETATRYLQEKRFDAAVETLQKARELDPYNEKVRTALGQATDEKRKADVGLLLNDARARMERSQFEEARTRVDKALQLDPHSLDAKSMLQALEREIELASRSAGLEQALVQGKLALKKDDFDRAIQSFEKALQIEPKHAETIRLLAEAKQEKHKSDELADGKRLLAARKFDEARRAFERALKADPASDEAKLGLEAARQKRLSVEQVRKAGLPVPALVGGAVGLVLVVGLIAWFLTRPTEAKLAIRAGDAAVEAGELDKASERYLAAAETAKGKDAERAAAKTKFAALYEPLVRQGLELKAKEVLDKQRTWNPADASVRPRYRELGSALAKRGLEKNDATLIEGASASYQAYLGEYKKAVPEDYAAIKDYLSLGEETMVRANDAKLEAGSRLKLYEQGQKLFTFVDEKDPTFGADTLRAEARASRARLEEVKGRIDAFQSEAAKQLELAQAAEADKSSWQHAIDAYDRVLKLVAENGDLAENVDLKRFDEMATAGRQNLNARLAAEAENATAEQKVALLLSNAESLEKSGNLRDALNAYHELLKADAAHAVARSKVTAIEQRIARAEGLKREASAALAANDLADAETKVAAALAEAPADADLLGLRTELEARKKTAAAQQQVAATLKAAQDAFAAGKLDEAEAKFKEVQNATIDKSLLAQVGKSLDQIRVERIKGQVEPIVADASALEAKGDFVGAQGRWQEVERLNPRDPRVAPKLGELRRKINAKRIGELEATLPGLFDKRAADPGALSKAIGELKSLDPANATLVETDRRIAAAKSMSDAKAALDKGDVDRAEAAIKAIHPSTPEAKSAEARALGERLQVVRKERAAADKAAADKLAGDRAATDKAAADKLAADKAAADRAAADKAAADKAAADKAAADKAAADQAAGEKVQTAATAGKWAEAARLLDSGVPAGGADAGRIYYNASVTVACKGCNLAEAKPWAAKAVAANYAGATRWNNTVSKFTACDVMMTTLCGSMLPTLK